MIILLFLETPGGYVSLYHRSSHVAVRSECLRTVAKVYGYMPLIPCKFSINKA